VQPNVLGYTVIAALLSALVETGILFVRDAYDDTLKYPWQVSKFLDLPVLGVISHHKNGSEPICQEYPGSPISEAFRSLCNNLMYTKIDDPLRSLLVTSPSHKEGKSIVSLNLSVVLAQAGNKVVLIDADLRCPTIHERLNLPNKTGLAWVLIGKDNLDNVMNHAKTHGLYAITTGEVPPMTNPGEILRSNKMDLMLNKLMEGGGMVVIDTPPVLPVADVAVMAPVVDGVLLVLQPGKTTLSAAREAVDGLRRVHANVVGVILNNVKVKNSGYKYLYPKKHKYSKVSGKKPSNKTNGYKHP
jgi:succinoglycan biosynthesis transport protein ExoP